VKGKPIWKRKRKSVHGKGLQGITSLPAKKKDQTKKKTEGEKLTTHKKKTVENSSDEGEIDGGGVPHCGKKVL